LTLLWLPPERQKSVIRCPVSILPKCSRAIGSAISAGAPTAGRLLFCASSHRPKRLAPRSTPPIARAGTMLRVSKPINAIPNIFVMPPLERRCTNPKEICPGLASVFVVNKNPRSDLLRCCQRNQSLPPRILLIITEASRICKYSWLINLDYPVLDIGNDLCWRRHDLPRHNVDRHPFLDRTGLRASPSLWALTAWLSNLTTNGW